MPWNTVLFKPGVDAVRSAFIADNGWNASNLIRFRMGLPEKNGGWARMSDTVLIGTARGIEAWADLTGIPYLVMGTEQRLELLALGGVTDITPLRENSDVAPDFSTVATTPTVTIEDANTPLGLAVGDWVNIDIPISVGGIIVFGLYTVATLITSTSYTITSAVNATGTVNSGGVVPTYTVAMASTAMKVTLPNNGLALDDPYVNEVATTVGSVALTAYQQFFVSNVIDVNNFDVTLAVAAVGNAGPVSENAGNAQIQYLVATGSATATLIGGFGVGLFGSGFYGTGTNGVTYTTIRQWFMDHWGEDWVGNYPGSPIFIWFPPVALGNRAIAIDTANFMGATTPPTKVNVSFVAMPEQIMMAFGVDPSGGAIDPNLVRWSDVADYTNWVATATNQAGSFRLPSGSRIVGAIMGPTFGLIFTDVDVWVFNYIGFPLVFGFNKISVDVGLLSGRCVAIAGSVVYWASNDGLWQYDGSSAQIVPCTVWDVMWQNLNRTQIDKAFIGVNSWFNEIAIFFVSTDPANVNQEVDSYIRYNYRDQVWDYGASGTLYASTCWADANVFGPSISVDLNKLIQQHEIAFDADGAQMMEYVMSDYFNLDTGWLLTAIDQVVTDFKFLGDNASLLYWVYVVDYPTDVPTINGPFTATLTTPQFSQINVQGRMAAIKIGLSSVGSWWRLGYTRYLFSPNGTI